MCAFIKYLPNGRRKFEMARQEAGFSAARNIREDEKNSMLSSNPDET